MLSGGQGNDRLVGNAGFNYRVDTCSAPVTNTSGLDTFYNNLCSQPYFIGADTTKLAARVSIAETPWTDHGVSD